MILLLQLGKTHVSQDILKTSWHSLDPLLSHNLTVGTLYYYGLTKEGRKRAKEKYWENSNKKYKISLYCKINDTDIARLAQMHISIQWTFFQHFRLFLIIHIKCLMSIDILKLICNLYVCAFVFMYVYTPYMCPVPTEVRGVYQIPWNWSCGYFGTTTWVLGIKSRSLGKATSPLNHWAGSPASSLYIFVVSLFSSWLLFSFSTFLKT